MNKTRWAVLPVCCCTAPGPWPAGSDEPGLSTEPGAGDRKLGIKDNPCPEYVGKCKVKIACSPSP